MLRKIQLQEAEAAKKSKSGKTSVCNAVLHTEPGADTEAKREIKPGPNHDVTLAKEHNLPVRMLQTAGKLLDESARSGRQSTRRQE